MAGDVRAHMVEAMGLAAAQHPHPNPRVGAVVLSPRDGEVIGAGAHARRGGPHAESMALDEAGPSARGGTLVVTLEPCAHRGATPPCVDRIVSAGIARVVVGAPDPDSRVSGRGIAALRSAGIEVAVGVAGVDAESVDQGYFHHRRTGLPRVTLKMAATLDGQAGAADGASQWVTSAAARDDAHRLRARSDAVMVGAGTVLADDPRLSARFDGAPVDRPMPVVIAGARRLPSTAAVFSRPALVYAPAAVDVADAEVVVLGHGDTVDLGAAIADLGRRGIVDLLVEGGPRLSGSLLRGGHVDRIVWYLGAGLAGGVGLPVVAGQFASMDGIRAVEVVGLDRVGPDIRVEAVVGAA